MSANELGWISPEPLARNTDPATSHEAAESARDLASRHAMLILEALHKHGAMSPTAIARVLGLDRSQVFRRMSDLEKNGLATPTGRVLKSPSNRNEREWMFVTGGGNG